MQVVMHVPREAAFQGVYRAVFFQHRHLERIIVCEEREARAWARATHSAKERKYTRVPAAQPPAEDGPGRVMELEGWSVG